MDDDDDDFPPQTKMQDVKPPVSYTNLSASMASPGAPVRSVSSTPSAPPATQQATTVSIKLIRTLHLLCINILFF